MRIQCRVRKRREGVSVIEAIILMIVLAMSIGAIFSTIVFTQQTLSFSRQDRDSRELLFNWVQTFESKWPRSRNWDNVTDLLDEAEDCIQDTAAELGGSWNRSSSSGTIQGFTVTVPRPAGVENGSMAIDITITTPDRGDRPFVKLIRKYNIYTTDTVSDDSV